VVKGTTDDTTEVADIVRRLEAYEAELRRENGIEPGMALFTSGMKSSDGTRKRFSNSGKNGRGNGADSKATDVSNETCFKCGKKGHVRKDCRSRKKKTKEGQSDEPSGDKVAVAQMWMMRAFTTQEPSDRARGNTATEWYLDSACTNHMTPHREAFITYRKLEPNERHVETATEDVVPADGIGSARLTCALPNGTVVETTVRDVLHVPLAGPSLLSVGQLSDPSTNLEVRVGHGGARIYRDNGKGPICGLGRKVGRMYLVIQRSTDIPKDSGLGEYGMGTTATATLRPAENMVRSISSLQLWDCRLGHLDHRKVAEMHRFATGIPSMRSPASLDRCTGCLEGKMVRHPFKPAERKTTQPLSLMHFDLCGPMQVESIGRSRCFLLGTDDFSRWRVVKFLHKKSDAPRAFEEIQAEFERHFSSVPVNFGVYTQRPINPANDVHP
jgi:hypothetical protein